MILNVPNNPLDTAFFVRPSRGAGMDPEAVMSAEVHELGVQLELRRSLDHHACEVIVPALAGNSADLPEGFDVTVHKELHAAARTKPNICITGPGQKKNKAVRDPDGIRHSAQSTCASSAGRNVSS